MAAANSTKKTVDVSMMRKIGSQENAKVLPVAKPPLIDVNVERWGELLSL